MTPSEIEQADRDAIVLERFALASIPKTITQKEISAIVGLVSAYRQLRTALTPEEAGFLLEQGFDYESAFAQEVGRKIRTIAEATSAASVLVMCPECGRDW